MSRFIETILFRNDEMPLIKGHEQRFAQTQMASWGKIIYPSLEKIIRNNKVILRKGTSYKCRVVYDAANATVEFSPYKKKKIKYLVLRGGNKIDYGFKYENREQLNALMEGLRPNAEVLIIKNQLFTDTSFTNIALWNGTEWHTPETPLLQGVQRNKLLEDKIIVAKDINFLDIMNYEKIRLFNAMVGWDEAWELDVKNIQF